jgi:hypothetical protein
MVKAVFLKDFPAAHQVTLFITLLLALKRLFRWLPDFAAECPPGGLSRDPLDCPTIGPLGGPPRGPTNFHIGHST